MVSNTRQTQQKNTVIKANYITTPPLVLAYALAGNVLFDFEHEYFGSREMKVSIRDLWPSRQEIEAIEDERIIRKVLKQLDETIQVINTDLFSRLKKKSCLLDWNSTMEFSENTAC